MLRHTGGGRGSTTYSSILVCLLGFSVYLEHGEVVEHPLPERRDVQKAHLIGPLLVVPGKEKKRRPDTGLLYVLCHGFSKLSSDKVYPRGAN